MSKSIDFNELCNLYKSDPEAFERYRKREIDKLIEKSSEKSQKRLRGLQFQIDAKRAIYKDKPYMSCMEISKMMHAQFNELNYRLNRFCKPNQYPQRQHEQEVHEPENAATVLAFRR